MTHRSRMTDAEYQELVNAPREAVSLRGFYRIQIVEPTGEVVGDSLWNQNQVTNDGINQFLVSALGSLSGSKYVSHLALGTGGAPAAAATSLTGEVGSRTAVTAATSSTSKTLRLTATFPSGWHTSTGAGYNISNIGAFNSSSGGTLFAGNTYTSSACASNQAVNVTYDITFA